MAVRQLKTHEVAGVLQQLVVRQKSLCAICDNKFTRSDSAVLDHNHDNGYIRGAVHRSCNGAEGKIKYKAMLGHKGVEHYAYIIALGKYLDHHSKPRINLIHPSHMTATEKLKAQREARNKKAREARKAKTKR